MNTPQLATPPNRPRSITHGTSSATLADVLERILDKGLVIAGDIKVKIVDIELLTIQIRLLICSVDKAREMGIDWWSSSPYLNPKLAAENPQAQALSARIERLEALQQTQPVLQPSAAPVQRDQLLS
ncbi:MAG: gas vesicle protein [Rhodoferax sp.]|uniref:gas vesicle protein n=1 Tax=Rhodoferax sp. TaxID=50421 RepID=UPI00260ACF22|nr:gas vesicle protein [Rhodoferax sp.]MDD5332565.1 gas vesicle protein [Rhodoferax sp.]